MELLLTRKKCGPKATIGSLFIDDQFECYTLEDVVRQVDGQPVSAWKIPNVTAIPRGRYQIIITLSQRFGFETPLLLNVEGYTAIRIHHGNTDADTDGCILVGQTMTDENTDFIGSSDAAYAALFPKIQAALQGGEKVFITIA
jgi:hypothetical protein